MIKSFKSLRQDFKTNRGRILWGLTALVIVDVLQLLIPRVVKYAVDDLTAGEITSGRLLFYGLQVLVLALGIGGFRYVWRYLLLGAARRIERALRDRFFAHLQSLSFSYFSRTKIGDLMAHATNDIEAVRMSMGLGLVFVLDTIILGILTIIFMIYIHPLLTLYAILPMPFITLVTLLFSRVIHRRFETLQKAFGSLTERVRESIAGIRVIQAYAREENEKSRLSVLSRDYLEKNLGVTRVWGMYFPLIVLFSNLSTAIVLYLGGKLTIFQAISVGDFVAFMSYLGTLAWPMMALGWSINMLQRGAASMDRLNRIFGEVPEISDSPKALYPHRLMGKIEVRDLIYASGNGGNLLLHGIQIGINPGERVIVVGRTGSGKSLLCDLLVRTLESPKDSIFYDGLEIHRLALGVLRRDVALVPQETLLFSDSIRENIAFGKPDAKDEEIEEAARMVQILDEIKELPGGMNTVIGEKGITLSGGQRQRIAIARAVLMDPPVFILDDALSSVDIQTEDRILENLERFLEGRTSILVTHRIAPLRKASRIIVLDEGRVVETGDHQTLLSKGGVYSDLYWKRQLEEELERER